MELIVRKAARSDAEAVVTVHENSIRELALVAYSRDVVSAWAAGKDPEKCQIKSDETHFLVAEIDDEIVSFGKLRPEAEEYFQADVEGEIRAIYVHQISPGRVLER